MANTKFVGWVPTILGRLSYSKIGHTTQGGLADRRPGHSNRAFVVRQNRNTSDAIFRRLRTRWAALRNVVLRAFQTVERPFDIIEFNYYLFAQKKPNAAKGAEPLIGHVMILPLNATFYSEQWASLDKSPQDVVALCNGIVAAAQAHNADVAAHDTLHAAARSAVLFSLELSRQGVVKIAMEVMPSCYSVDDIAVEAIAYQVLCFLKDISHKHQHHPQSSDSLFRLQRDDADGVWAHEIQRELQRAVLTARRVDNDCNGRLDALGIAAYSESFTKLATPLVKTPLAVLDFNALRESVHIVNNKVETIDTRSERLFSRWVGVLGLMLAFIASYHLLSAVLHAALAVVDPMKSAEAISHLQKELDGFLPPIKFLGHHLFVVTGRIEDIIVTSLLWTAIVTAFVLTSSHRARRWLRGLLVPRLILSSRMITASPHNATKVLWQTMAVSVAILIFCIYGLYILLK